MRAGLLLLFACGHALADAKRAPHSHPIRRVAITDEGDAAVSIDGAGVRLWSTLDGTQAPRVLAGAAARDVAITHAGGELLIAFLDDAGGLELRRITSDGEERGHASVPNEPAIAQLAAFGDGVLALGVDQIVRWYRADGALRGALAAPTRLSAIATRRGGAIVLDERGKQAWMLATSPLAWSAPIALPEPLRAPSLSPDHARLAGVAGGRGVVLALAPRPRQLAAVALDATEPAWTGFTSEASAVFATRGKVASWGAKIDAHKRGALTPLAIGDRHALAGEGTALALFDAPAVRFLGYGALAVMATPLSAKPFALAIRQQMVWLDDKLQLQHRLPANDHRGPLIAIDDHLYVANTWQDNRSAIVVGDATTGREHPLMESTNFVRWQASSRVLSADIHDPQSRTGARRFAIDAVGATTELAPLKNQEATMFWPTDPARANGAYGVMLTGSSCVGFTTLLPNDGRRDVCTERGSSVLTVIGDGTAFAREKDTLVVYRDGKLQRRVATPYANFNAYPSEDGAAMIAVDGDELTAFSTLDGAKRWQHMFAQVRGIAWSADGAGVLVSTDNGALALDAITGDIRASACGWDFGIHDDLDRVAFTRENVCE